MCGWGGKSHPNLNGPAPSSQVGLPQPLVRRKATFWVNHGLLKERRQQGADGGGGGSGAASSASSRRGRAGAAAVGRAVDACPVYRRAQTLDARLHGRSRKSANPVSTDECPPTALMLVCY